MKIEWSKLFSGVIAFGFGGFGIWCGIEYYNLTRMAIETNAMVAPDSTLAVTCVSVVIGALLSYLLYQMGLKNSRNRYGIDESGQPYKQKHVVYDDPEKEEEI